MSLRLCASAGSSVGKMTQRGVDSAGAAAGAAAAMAHRQYCVRRAMGHMFFQAATLVGAGTASAELFRAACGGDAARTAVWLTSSLSAGAVFEVFFFQLVGRATDRTGRKWPWLFLSPAMSFVAGLAPFLSPRLPVVWASRLLTSSFSALFGGTNMTCAMISDCVSGDELASAFSLLSAMAGIGLFVGSQTGSFLHRRFGDPRYGLLGQSFFAALGFLHNLSIPETLPPSERRQAPLSLRDASPFGFVKLLTRSRATSTLALAATLAVCSEGKVTSDLKSLWVRDLGMSLPLQGNFLSFSLLLGWPGGFVGSRLIQKFGRRKFTSIACGLSLLGHAMVAQGGVAAQWLAYVIMAPSLNANHAAALKASASKMAESHGLGRGEFQASMASLRSLVIATVPLLYGRLYGAQLSMGVVPRYAWWAVAVLGAVMPELLHRTLRDEDMQVVAQPRAS